ncbi:large conductance mechanosensitive channel protein MscL [Candidatus Phytoplasma ziziphi]|uniref:Large conductance mechanosensitive channel protein MscL n=2 Tax=Acholeplasmataceae TaxID=2146 RepID=A0A660HNH4_ZIZJU|nr:large conductance mechanosensitive channel protein MscL [Candidatus Phytoplasma ziziphi]AYJ01522.1 large conductance mechanosensitive channel protein MscL [Candidatus Phytoplasma ziziphi]
MNKMNFENIKKFRNGFKEFIIKGDIIKLIVAFIMGQLFTKVISSLSTDIIMPPINLLLNRHSIRDWKINLNNNISINYGNFLQNLFEFFLVSLVIYTILIYIYQKIVKTNDSSTQSNLQKKEIYATTELLELEKEKIQILKEIQKKISEQK